MRRIIAQTRKELTQIVRDRLALALALVLPVFLLLLLSTAISLTVTGMPIVVQDLDSSPASRDFIDAFRASQTFHVVSWPSDRQPSEAFRANTARAARTTAGVVRRAGGGGSGGRTADRRVVTSSAGSRR